MTDADGTLRRVGIVEHGGRPAAIQAAEHVRRWCDEHGVPWADIDVWDADAPRRSAHDDEKVRGDGRAGATSPRAFGPWAFLFLDRVQ